MERYLPYGQHEVSAADIEAVVDVLRSGWLTTGPAVERFEGALAERFGARHAVAVATGTAALHAAYFAAGVGRGDEVVTTPITFAATANAAAYLGARPVFADVDPRSVLLTPAAAASAMTERTRVVAPVDFAGHPVDVDALRELAEAHDATLVEDACHALGATVRGRPVGSLAHLTVFSFHPVKHVATGEGGAVLTDDGLLARRLRSFRSHGMVHANEQLHHQDEGPWYHEQHHLGFNYRITDLQCALGVSQLGRLDAFLARRQSIAAHYDTSFADLALDPLPCASGVTHARHVYVIRLRGEDPPRRRVFEALRARALGVQVHYLPVYRHPYYRQLGYPAGLCPAAEDYYSRCITIPLFPAMTDADVERVVRDVREVVSEGGQVAMHEAAQEVDA